MTKNISYPCIVAAKHGDPEAMEKILGHYRPYIASLSKRSFYDESGCHHEFVDDSIRQRIEARLMYKIIYHFDPARLPEGETLEPD